MGKNRYKKAAIAAAGLLLAAVSGVAANFYLIGEPIDGKQVYCTASVNGTNLNLQVETAEPGAALRGFAYKNDGSTLYISARKVPVSPLFPRGPYEISVDITRTEKVLFGNRAVWPENGPI